MALARLEAGHEVPEHRDVIATCALALCSGAHLPHTPTARNGSPSRRALRAPASSGCRAPPKHEERIDQ